MATVATGMPDGICTVESRASSPSRVELFTGMPMTGRVLAAARAPARCAALPAAAMMAPKPASRAVSAKFRAASGVRCADMTRTSVSMPSASSWRTAFSTTGQSLSLPITTAIFLLTMPSPPKVINKNVTRPRHTVMALLFTHLCSCPPGALPRRGAAERRTGPRQFQTEAEPRPRHPPREDSSMI